MTSRFAREHVAVVERRVALLFEAEKSSPISGASYDEKRSPTLIPGSEEPSRVWWQPSRKGCSKSGDRIRLVQGAEEGQFSKLKFVKRQCTGDENATFAKPV